jgi:hypothetical protein
MAMDERVDQSINQRPEGDADVDGTLARALFVGVILILLVLIYALATAAW